MMLMRTTSLLLRSPIHKRSNTSSVRRIGMNGVGAVTAQGGKIFGVKEEGTRSGAFMHAEMSVSIGTKEKEQHYFG